MYSALDLSVFESLDNAVNNGYTFEGWTPERIAQDLVHYEPLFETHEPNMLHSAVQKWQEKQNDTKSNV